MLDNIMRILESALYVTDLAVAETFYNQLLGTTPYRNEAGRHIFYRLDGQVLLLFNADETIKPSDFPIPAHGAHGQGHVCFSSEPIAIQDWRKRLAELGIDIESDYTWENGAQSLYFRDPSKNSLEIAEPKLWEFD